MAPGDPTEADAPTLRSSVGGVPVVPADQDPLLNARVGDYVVTERLGVGGMGLVYAALQPVIGKAVAIKVLRPEVAQDPEQAKRLFNEANALARIQHRGIVDIFNLGQLPDGRHYLVMELLHGEALSEMLRRRGRLPVREALELFDELLSALGAAHQAGLIHRDLKPSNIFLITQSDGTSYVKLLDFGLAKQSKTPSGETPQTRTDVVVGTPEYIAPEQARAAAVGPYTDLYAAGVVLFEMLTGRLPFLASTAIEYVVQHLEATAPPASGVADGVPPELDALLARLLAKDPAARPASATEVRAALAPMRAARPEEAPSPSPAGEAAASRSYTLRLGTRFELGLSWITPALGGLRRACPERTLHLCFGDSPELMRLLRSGQLDCAVTSARLRGEWIRRVELHEETYALVAAPELARAWERGAQPEATALADVHADLPLFRYLLEAHPPAGAWQFARTEVLGTIAAVKYRVQEGEAVAVLPTYFIQGELASGALVPLLPGVTLQRDHFRLVWREGHPRDADIQRLAEQLRALPLR